MYWFTCGVSTCESVLRRPWNSLLALGERVEWQFEGEVEAGEDYKKTGNDARELINY